MPQARGRLGARTTILAAAVRHSAPGENKRVPAAPEGGIPGSDMAHHVPDRPVLVAGYGNRDMVAHITAMTIPPSMKSVRPSSSPKA
jgi:hypothetical protein